METTTEQERDKKRPRPSTSNEKDPTRPAAPNGNPTEVAGHSKIEDPATRAATIVASRDGESGGSIPTNPPGDPHLPTLSKRAIKDNNVPTFRLARKLQKLNLRAQNHVNNLGSLLEAGRVPKGLNVRRFPLNIPNPSVSFQLQWDKAHMELSQRLTRLLYEFWCNKLKESGQDLDELNRNLESKCTLDEHAHVVELLASSRKEYLNELNARNAKKVQIQEPMEEGETTE